MCSMKSVERLHLKNGKQWLFRIGKWIFLGFVIWLVFHNHYEEIYQNVRRVTSWKLLCLLLLGSMNQLFSALAFYVLVKGHSPAFSFRKAFVTTYLGVFGNVAAFSVGSIPLRAYYLHKNHIEAGKVMEYLTIDYVLQKSAVLICNTLLLLFGGSCFFEKQEEIGKPILFGYGITLLVILFLLFLGCSNMMYRNFSQLLLKVPEHGKWKERREMIQTQLDVMHKSSKELKNHPKKLFTVLSLHCLKLLILYAIPFICIRMMTSQSVSFLEMQQCAGVANLIANAVPNVSGIGGVELGFLLAFRAYLDRATNSSVLVVYRLVTYFVPFLISIVVCNLATRVRK